MKTSKGCIAVLLLGMFVQAAFSDPTLNYQGRIMADGVKFNGNGYFKFVLRNNNFPTVGAFWANSGDVGVNGTNEPPNYTENNVNNGLFNVELGNTWMGMNAIPAVALHTN